MPQIKWFPVYSTLNSYTTWCDIMYWLLWRLHLWEQFVDKYSNHKVFKKMGLDETAGPCLAITLTITTTTVPSPRDEVLEDTSRTKISVLGLKIPRSCTWRCCSWGSKTSLLINILCLTKVLLMYEIHNHLRGGPKTTGRLKHCNFQRQN